MIVPAPVEQLHEAHARFDQSSREQTVVGQTTITRLCTIVVERLLRLTRDVHHFRDTGLHAISQLVLRNPRLRFGMPHGFDLQLIEFVERIERLSPKLAIHARLGWTQTKPDLLWNGIELLDKRSARIHCQTSSCHRWVARRWRSTPQRRVSFRSRSPARKSPKSRVRVDRPAASQCRSVARPEHD